MMNSNPPSSTPPWLREELDVAQPLKDPIGNRPEHVQQPADGRKTKVVYWMLKIVTMCLCVLLCGTAVIGIGKDGLISLVKA